MNSRQNKSVAFASWIHEPEGRPIENKDFLESYLQFGAWLRLVQAYEHLRTIDTTDQTMRRLAAVAGVFSALGALIEDVSATLLSWCAWNQASDLRLADALLNVAFVRDDKQRPSTEFIEQSIQSIVQGKRTRVDAQVFAKALLQEGAVSTLRRVGVPWKTKPSVKVARGGELVFWDKLPRAMEEVLTVLAAESTVRLYGAYNKIKHGPQLIVDDILMVFRDRGARAETLADLEEMVRSRHLSPLTLRVLFRGATTRTGIDKNPPCLWLEDDRRAIRQILAVEFFNLGKIPWILAGWLRKLRFGGAWIPLDPVIQNLEEDVARARSGRG